MKFKTLLFDLDGTLADTAPDLTAALNHVLQDAGRDAVPLDEVRHMVGFGGRKLIQHGFAFTGRPIREEKIETAFERFIGYYAENIATHTVLFPHVNTTLGRLAESGAKFAICTNKPEALSVALIEKLGLKDLFPVILGADSLENNKPHGDHLLLAISKLGGNAETSVMIGDSQTDVDAARAAGIPVVLVSFGYSAVPPEDLEADALIDDFSLLPGTLDALS